MYFISLNQVPIREQLLLEEKLLREETASFCLVNMGSQRTIVLGVSNRPEALLYQDKVEAAGIPVIRRFSGGGTVIVDEGTLFVTLILNEQDLAAPLFPEPILRFGEALYRDSWHIPAFHLKENDYVIGHRKCGGNAQYIRKGRCLQHTSFLWDYQEHNMDFLRIPDTRPNYRAARSHRDFLCRLKEHYPERSDLIAQLQQGLQRRVGALHSCDSGLKWAKASRFSL